MILSYQDVRTTNFTMASSSSSPFSINFTFPPTRTCSSSFRLFCSNQIIQLETQQIIPKKKNQRKPRPSFSEQVLEKWSRKPTSLGDKFPWQKQEMQQQEDKFAIKEEEEERVLDESRIGSNSFVGDSVSFDSIKSVNLAPWVKKTKPQKESFDFEDGNSQKDSGNGKIDGGYVSNSFVGDSVSFDSIKSVNLAPWVKKTKPQKESFDFEDGNSQKDSGNGTIDGGYVSNSFVGDSVSFESKKSVKLAPWVQKSKPQKQSFDFEDGNLEKDSEKDEIDDEHVSNNGQESQRSERVPWEREKDLFQSNSNTPLAEKLIPEFELKRLRNKAGRMVERFRVGAAGVTQELVESIHDKWKTDEVVKLKFKGPSTMNMKRIHESLEVSNSVLLAC
ncbi:putative RNA-binding, CRM domain, YhbY-like superfamily [Helianthus debilis subsp. tardiflorus]